MSYIVRASKFRHVYIDPAKADHTYQNLRLSTTAGDQSFIKGNTKFFAVSIEAGGGAMAVIPYEKYGKFDTTIPLITGHTGTVLDFDFNPFHEHIIASGSEDTTVKVWGIPEGGLTEHLADPLVDLHGHGRRVTLLRFHPTASNVLASASADFTTKLWDIEKGTEVHSIHQGSDLIQDIVWNYDGDLLASSSKDRVLRIHDPRSGAVAAQKEDAHEGAKSVKLTFLGPAENHRLISVGFTRQSQRQFKIWDPRNMGKELKKVDIDQAAGVILPFYDPDTRLLYLCGKGDGNIRYYEMTDSDPYYFTINEYRSTVAAKGMAMIPKRGLDIMACETARLLKLTSSSVEPLHVFVPRKSDAFQEDIFPDTYAGVPSMTADDWLRGVSRGPALLNLKPGSGKITMPTAKSASSTPATSAVSRGNSLPRAAAASPPSASPPSAPSSSGSRGPSASDLQKQLDEANKKIQKQQARIAELEAKCRRAGISY